MWSKEFVLFMLLFCVGIALDLPEDFKKCKRSDSDLNGCLKEAIVDALSKLEKGNPDFKFAPAQPLNVPSMTIGEGKGAVHVVQKFKNIKFYNFFRPKIENLEAKITDTEVDLSLDLLYDEVVMDAEYDFNGQILVVPIVGTGPCKVVFSSTKVHVTIHGEEFKKKGQSYFEIKDVEIKLKPAKITFDFKNLFNGDKTLGDEMNKLLNENWKEFWADVDVAYADTIALIYKNFANLIFKKVPHNRIFLQ